jgi:hypothetical protein
VSKIKKQGSQKSVMSAFIAREEFPAFSFQHLTTNKGYNFDYFSSANDAKDASYSLISKLIESSRHRITELLSWDKKRGFETIPYSRIRRKLSFNELEISDDSKLHVLRFGGQEYRAICFKQPNALGVFHIVMLDFSHSAYDHG